MVRVLFLQDNAINESLALAEVSAVLRAGGHATQLLLADEESKLGQSIQSWDPALVVIPCSIANHETALDLASQAKAAVPEAHVLLGGTHATFEPEIALHDAVDSVCVGEAELSVRDLAAALDAGTDWKQIPNLAFGTPEGLQKNPLRPLIEDLDSLPLPDRELYFRYPFIARFPWKKFMTGRGCVHSCSFCWNTTLREMYEGKGSFVRRKSPTRAVDEIVAVAATTPLKRVHFSDDLFTIHPAWLEEFAPMYRDRVGIPFSCNTSIELVSPRAMAALAMAGCQSVAIGVETGNEELRSRILRKTVTNADVRQAAQRIKDAGMDLVTFNMLASPGETLEDAFATVRLNQEIGADHVRVNLAVPIPHTDFERTAEVDGHLGDGHGHARVASLEHPEVAFDSDDARAFVNLFYLFRLAVHNPSLNPVIRKMVHMPLGRVLDPLRLMIPLEEKRINALGWRDGLRYFSHVGDPHKKTSNYVTLI
jgi:radical SAM superfamily enzyme YgiQ (UPF0313 family)